MHIFHVSLVLFFCAFAPGSWAVPFERSLPVSVFITANQASPGLEIVADNYVFQSVYDQSLQTMSPLSIPFRVRSLTGQNVKYELVMSHLAGHCGGQPLNLTVTSMFTGDPIILNVGHEFAGIENDHGVVISFPTIPQTDLSQQCEGHIGVIAEIVP